MRKFEGSKYQQTKHLPRTEIAKLIRQDIKDAISKNQLPVLSVSVRCPQGSRSIDVVITDFEFPILNPEHLKLIKEGRNVYSINKTEYPRYTKIASMTIEKLESICNAYNFDDSDSMTDYFHVNFYCHPQFAYSLTRKEEDSHK